MDKQEKFRPEIDKAGYGPWFDSKYILRLWRRWFFAVFCTALTAGILAYVLTDMFLPNTYTASALVSVVPKTNNTNNITSRNMEGAMIRSVNMWNSNVLMKEIKGPNNEKNIQGTFSAVKISTNIIRVEGRAQTAQEAYYLLSAAIGSYKPLAPNFDSEYNSIVLTRVTRESLDVVRRRPLAYAAMAFVAVFALIYMILLIWSMFTQILHNEVQARQLLAVSLYEAVPMTRKRGKKTSILVNRPGTPYSFQERIDHLASRVSQHMHRYNQKIVMITSVTASEGKSTISSNLALTLARRGKSVLLLDFDLRKPSVAKVFGRKERNGEEELFSVVQRNAPLAASAEQWPEVPTLHVVWQFHAVKDSDQRVEESNLTELLEEAKDQFDYIVIDTPPMAPVRDTKVLARSADCTVMVLRQDLAHAAAANAAIDHLEECGAPCAGAVLNQCQGLARVERRGRGKYGNKYGYYYGYGYRQEAKS